MTEEQINTLNEDFDDFLYKVVMNYDINYAALAGIIMARMVTLARVAQSEDILLLLLPHMENSLRDEPNGKLHH